MTVAAQTPAITYTGNGASTVFAAPFRYIAPSDLTVVLRAVDGAETTLNYGSEFTAAPGNTNAGGNVTLAEPPISGTKVLISRRTARTQPADYIASGAFTAESHEEALDRAMLVIQEQEVELDRTIRAPRGEAGPVLAPRSALAGQLLAMSDDGEEIVGTDAIPAIAGMEAAAVAAVGNAGTAQVAAVNAAGTSRITAVNSAGSTQISAVNSAGASQVDAVEAAALSIGSVAQAFLIEGAIAAGATFVVDRAVLSGVPFSRFHARVTGGSGSVQLVVLVNGIAVHGPVTVDAAGRTDAVTINAPLDADIEFSVFSVTGAPTVVFIKMVGLPA